MRLPEIPSGDLDDVCHEIENKKVCYQKFNQIPVCMYA